MVLMSAVLGTFLWKYFYNLFYIFYLYLPRNFCCYRWNSLIWKQKKCSAELKIVIPLKWIISFGFNAVDWMVVCTFYVFVLFHMLSVKCWLLYLFSLNINHLKYEIRRLRYSVLVESLSTMPRALGKICSSTKINELIKSEIISYTLYVLID